MNSKNAGLSIIIPCLNEEQTLETCIRKAFLSIKKIVGLENGEVIVADNGSTDSSIAIAERLGARVVHVAEKGYGSALRGGIYEAKNEFLLMGDADDSYDFGDIAGFYDALMQGYDLVMGNRFMGGIEKGAMPWSHKYIGNPILSGIGRIFYRTNIGDFHCGMRAFRKSKIMSLNLSTTGMEFASEMVVKSVLFHLRIIEVPCRLYPDGRNRPPHLRSIPDGFRHLLFLLIYCPRWLFLYPGIGFAAVGLVFLITLFISPLYIFSVRLETITMFYAAISLLLGFQAIQFSLFTNIYGRRIGQLPDTSSFLKVVERFMKRVGFIVSAVLIAFGALGIISTFIFWGNSEFGTIYDTSVHRAAILFGTILVLGFEMSLSCFFVNVLHMGKDG